MMERAEADLALDYDDNLLDAIEKVNRALEKHGLKFEPDEEPHDGFELYKLEKVAAP